MNIIGLHNGHDASVTVFKDGEILFHFELERFYRQKHIGGFEQKNLLINFLRENVLPQIGWSVRDIDTVCLSSPYGSDGKNLWTNSDFKSVQDKIDYIRYPDVPYGVTKSDFLGKEITFFISNHHMNHMAYSYYTSNFKDALLFAYDGQGDFNVSNACGIGKDNKINYLSDFSEPFCGVSDAKIGIYYHLLGRVLPFLGKTILAVPGKAMGLSSYGKVRKEWISDFERIILKRDFERIILKRDFEMEVFKAVMGTDENIKSTDVEAQDFLATFQHVVENYVVVSLKRLMEQTNSRNLCISGGCGLNVLVNSRVRNEVCKNLYIPPACSDVGQSIGSVLYYWHHVLDNPFNGMEWHTPYLGSVVSNKEFDYKSEFKDIVHKKSDDIFRDTAELLKGGNIIGWAQGRTEIGPRALGNRSILCNPSISNMKDLLNQKVKEREWWRPFAPVCLWEDARDWFDIEFESPYMLESFRVKKDKVDLVPAITHVDQTARVQTVTHAQNPFLYRLLTEFKRQTGIPMLLNTSLNGKGEPIINDCYYLFKLLSGTKMDNIVVDDTIFSKTTVMLM